MKDKNYKIVSLYSFFPFQENLIHDLKNKLLSSINDTRLMKLPNPRDRLENMIKKQ